MKKISFGIIGFGNIGTRYRDRIKENNYCELAAVCDTKKEKLGNLNKDIKTYSDFTDLVKDTDIDVVVVATPNHLHKEMTIAALKANKHVICEKPMALTTKDAKAMVLASQKTDKKLFVVKQNRFNPPIKKVKELITNDKLGKIGLVTVDCFWNRNDDYYSSSDWKGKKEKDGGTLFTQFSHFIDIAYYLFGDISSVYATGFNFTHQNTIEFEDTGVVLLKFESGAIGSFNYTTSSYQQNMEGSVTIFGEKGSIKIGGQYLNTLEYTNVEGIKKIVLEKGNLPNDYGTYKGSMSNHDKILTNVVNTLNGKEFVATSGFEGMRIVQIIEAIYKSIDTNKEVAL